MRGRKSKDIISRTYQTQEQIQSRLRRYRGFKDLKIDTWVGVWEGLSCVKGELFCWPRQLQLQVNTSLSRVLHADHPICAILLRSRAHGGNEEKDLSTTDESLRMNIMSRAVCPATASICAFATCNE